MDKVDQGKRSQIMSRIRSVETRIEIKVRKWLFAKGLRYRKNVKNLPGKPDIVFRKYHTIVLVNGCFWHGHGDGCADSHIPKTQTEMWRNKIIRNQERDIIIQKKLTDMGWRVFVVWECAIEKDFYTTMERLYTQILSIE